MSRNGLPPAPPARNLSLTEELEKLEQSITLTLQEIDSNFSRAHRIVTTSILPLVEQYGEHSRAVWDASKFWKQFFEASANVSLSGYEELAADADDENTMTATVEESTSSIRDDTTGVEGGGDCTPRPRGNDNTPATGTRTTAAADESSVLSDDGGTLTGSTPRPPATKSVTVKPQFAGLGSPYDLLRREMKQKEAGSGAGASPSRGVDGEDDESDTELLFQQHTARLPAMSMTPRPSGGGAGASSNQHRQTQDDDEDDSAFLFSGARPKPQDPLMHRVLDKNYRLMATPLKGGASSGVSPIRWRVTEKKNDDTAAKGKQREGDPRPIWADSPASSPEIAMPKLRSEAFLSPARPSAYRQRLAAATAAPRTPGVSVQTPAAAGGKTRDVYARTPGTGAAGGGEKETDEITWESSGDEDLDVYGGMSPPKTIQFALPPSKLLQTPAREASKRIVEDILMTAGADPDEEGEYSPTMVKMNPDLLDDTF